MRTILEQVKYLQNIISSVEINVDKAAQLRELYIIKLKRYIFMLETNVPNFSEGKNSRVDLKHKPKYMIS